MLASLTGSSVKWASSHLNFQFGAQDSTVYSGMRLKIQLIRIQGQALSLVSDILGKFIMPNPFVNGGTVYDMNSDRDPDYFRNYRVIMTKIVTVPPDTVGTDIPVKQVKFGVKFGHHIRCDNNVPTVASGQVVLLITADRGNHSTNTASTLNGISIPNFNRGIRFQYGFTHYFYDN